MIVSRFMVTRETPAGIDEFLVKCPSCEHYSPADVMITSKYIALLFIPLFPVDKDANVNCKTCGLKRFEMNFDASLITNYDEVKSRFRHPWFTYTGAVLFGLVLIIAVVAALK